MISLYASTKLNICQVFSIPRLKLHLKINSWYASTRFNIYAYTNFNTNKIFKYFQRLKLTVDMLRAMVIGLVGC